MITGTDGCTRESASSSRDSNIGGDARSTSVRLVPRLAHVLGLGPAHGNDLIRPADAPRPEGTTRGERDAAEVAAVGAAPRRRLRLCSDSPAASAAARPASVARSVQRVSACGVGVPRPGSGAGLGAAGLDGGGASVGRGCAGERSPAAACGRLARSRRRLALAAEAVRCGGGARMSGGVGDARAQLDDAEAHHAVGDPQRAVEPARAARRSGVELEQVVLGALVLRSIG